MTNPPHDARIHLLRSLPRRRVRRASWGIAGLFPCLFAANPSCAVRKEQENQLIEAGNGCWKVGMGQVEILRRCFPWELPEVKTTYSCAVIQVGVRSDALRYLCCPRVRSNGGGTSPFARSNICAGARPQADGTTLNRPIDTKSDKYGDVCSGG